MIKHQKAVNNKAVDLLLYLILGSLLVCLIHGEQRELFLREKTSDVYSDEAISIHFAQPNSSLLEQIISDAEQLDLSIFCEEGGILACNPPVITKGYFNILSGEKPTIEMWTENVTLIGKKKTSEVVGSNVDILGENMRVIGIVGYEGLYAKTDYMSIVPLDFYCRQADYQIPQIIVDGSSSGIGQFRILLNEHYSNNCSIQPVKSVGLREVYHTYDKTISETKLMLAFVMLFALFEHVLYLYEGSRKNVLPFIEMGYGSTAITWYFTTKTLLTKTCGLFIGIVGVSLILQVNLMSAFIVGSIVVCEITMGTAISLRAIAAKVQGGNE